MRDQPQKRRKTVLEITWPASLASPRAAGPRHGIEDQDVLADHAGPSLDESQGPGPRASVIGGENGQHRRGLAVAAQARRCAPPFV